MTLPERAVFLFCREKMMNKFGFVGELMQRTFLKKSPLHSQKTLKRRGIYKDCRYVRTHPIVGEPLDAPAICTRTGLQIRVCRGGIRSLFSAKIKKAIIVVSAISHPLRRKAKPKRTIIVRRSAKNFKKGTGKNSGISVCFKLKFER